MTVNNNLRRNNADNVARALDAASRLPKLSEAEEMIDSINSQERETLYNGLMQRELHDARAKAMQVADLLASYLQFLGRVSPVLANDALEVRAIVKRLGETPWTTPKTNQP